MITELEMPNGQVLELESDAELSNEAIQNVINKLRQDEPELFKAPTKQGPRQQQTANYEKDLPYFTKEEIIEGARPWVKGIGGGAIGILGGLMSANPAVGLAAGIGGAQLVDSTFDYIRQLAGVDAPQTASEAFMKQMGNLKRNTEEELIGDLGMRAIGLLAKGPTGWLMNKIASRMKTKETIGKDLFVASTESGDIIAKNMEEAKAIEERIPGLKFTTAHQRGDLGSFAVERGVRKADKKAEQEFTRRTQKNTEALGSYLESQLGKLGGEEFEEFASQAKRQVDDFAAKAKQDSELGHAQRVAEFDRVAATKRAQQDQFEAQRQQELRQIELDRTRGYDESIAQRQAMVDSKRPDPRRSLREVGDIAKEEHALMLKDVNKMEEAMYNELPNFDVPYSDRVLRDKISSISKLKPGEGEGNIPSSFLDNMKALDRIAESGRMPTLRDLQGLRSTVKEEIAALQSVKGTPQGNNRKLARASEYNKVIDNIFKEIESNEMFFTDAERGFRKQLQRANAFTKQKFDRFYGDSIGGQIGAPKGYGQKPLQSELVGPKVFKPDTKGGAGNSREFMETFGSNPRVVSAMQDYVDQDFIKNVTDINSFNKWRFEHKETLSNLNSTSRYDSWENAQSALERAASRKGKMEAEMKRERSVIEASNLAVRKEMEESIARGKGQLDEVSKANAARVAEANAAQEEFNNSILGKVVGREPKFVLDRLIKKQYSSKEYSELLRQVKGNPQAEEALHNSYVRKLVDASKPNDKSDAFARSFNGQYGKLKKLMDDHDGALKIIKETRPEKVAALEDYRDVLNIMARSERPTPAAKDEDFVETAMRLASTALGLKKRRYLNTVRGVMHLDKFMNKHEASELLRRAMFDPDLAYSLKYLAQSGDQGRFHKQQIKLRIGGRLIDASGIVEDE